MPRGPGPLQCADVFFLQPDGGGNQTRHTLAIQSGEVTCKGEANPTIGFRVVSEKGNFSTAIGQKGSGMMEIFTLPPSRAAGLLPISHQAPSRR